MQNEGFMASVLHMLENSDPALLPLLAETWGVKIDTRDRTAAVKLLEDAMLDPARAEAVWEKLNDAQRGALQVLISNRGVMAEKMFTRLFSEIRRLGAAQIEREQPLVKPAGTAESLYYRGIIGAGFETGKAGAESIVYIPEDLLKILPTHKTSYDTLDESADDFPDEDEDEPLAIPVIDKPDAIRAADTSLVDDLTTLLAFIQLYAPAIQSDTIVEASDLMPYLLIQDTDRLIFLLGIAVSMDFLDTQAGRLYVKRPEVRRWLEISRAEQVKALAEAWRRSEAYHDLWHVPGLVVEREAGTMPQYHPSAAREAMIALVENAVPREGWWAQDAFIDAMKVHDRDFQRPNGDYDSWYIQNAQGEYLAGEESWDAVEGSLLFYYLNGPLHWLGLLDIAEGAARLTAYGRAFVARGGYPQAPDTPDKITIRDDGTLLLSRKVSRIDRFQVARFSTWISGGDPYTYRLDGASITRAAEQGINISHITSFLEKANGNAALPANVVRLLETWRGGAAAAVTFERLLVLRTTSGDTLDFIFDTPALRRYLGARLGAMAVVIRADEWAALQTALGEHGIEVELIGF
jgi:hypothetical protein